MDKQDWFLLTEPGLLLQYEERFDGERIGEYTLERISLENETLVLRRVQDEEASEERYRITPEGAWQGERKVWSCPWEAEWEEAHPQVGVIRCKQTLSSTPIEQAGARWERVLLVTCASEGGQSTQAFAPRIGLLYSRYLADGTPGERILTKIARTER